MVRLFKMQIKRLGTIIAEKYLLGSTNKIGLTLGTKNEIFPKKKYK